MNFFLIPGRNSFFSFFQGSAVLSGYCCMYTGTAGKLFEFMGLALVIINRGLSRIMPFTGRKTLQEHSMRPGNRASFAK